jgi:hypothetical protein
MSFLRQQFHKTKECGSSHYFANSIILVKNTSKTQRKTGYSLFWDITQLGFVVSYRRIETAYVSHHPGSSSPRLPLD